MSWLPVVAEWEPVLGMRMGAIEKAPDRVHLEQLVSELGLQPLRWPGHWPPETQMAMLAATYAKRLGRAVAFSLAAFRQAFAGGRDLGERETVLIAGAACEIHPTALLKSIGLRSVDDALQAAVKRARAAGATTLPAIQVGDRVFEGLGALQEAATALGAGV